MSDPHRDPYHIGQDNRLAGDRFVCGDCGYLWPTLALGTPFEFDRCRECGGRMTAAWNAYPGGDTDG
jgi:NMD protein affecting ribosome stability and mRNA decay